MSSALQDFENGADLRPGGQDEVPDGGDAVIPPQAGWSNGVVEYWRNGVGEGERDGLRVYTDLERGA
jgi:hypothetical protein